MHVHPDFHRRGIGRSLVLGLAAGRSERTAVLSTQDANVPAKPSTRAPASRAGSGERPSQEGRASATVANSASAH